MARRRVITLVAGVLLALGAALIAIPGLASAHIPNASLSCNTQSQPVLTISLTFYTTPTGSNHNTVSATIDGVSVLSTTNFTTTYNGTFPAGSATTGHTAQVVVFAWDDPTGSHGWTKTINLSSNSCQTATSSPTVHITASPTVHITASPTVHITASPTVHITASPTVHITASPTTAPTETPFESFQGETATPFSTGTPSAPPTDPGSTETPFESFEGETGTPGLTPPPTSTDGNGPGNSSTPLFALLLCLAFGGVGVAAARMQRRSIRP